jgi:G:T/U-mismatch repair DNA glycosylase
MNWFWTFYEKLVKKDAAIQQRPLEKKVNAGVNKVVGPLVK